MTELEKDGGVDKVEHSVLPDVRDHGAFYRKMGLGNGGNDEAVKVLENYSGDQSWTEEEEKRLRRRIDWKLMPLLCITYGLQYYDKAMLSQAALFGLVEDLDLGVSNRYSFTSSIFYLGFIIGAYPAMVLAQKFPVERVASAIVTLWGICLLLTIVCTGYRGIYAQRFFLGMLESGVSPLFMLIVGSWYKKNEQAFRMGIWYSIVGYVSIISPLINFGLGHAHGALSPWRYMYIFAGSITTLWGVLLLFVLPPDPIRAKGFDDRQRYILVARLRVNNSGVRNTSFKSGQVKELVCDVRFWLLFWAGMLSMIANGAVSTFIPIIIHGFGFNTLVSLLLVTPLGAYSGTLMLIASYLAYKIPNSRTYIMFLCEMGTLIGSALLWKLPLSNTGGLLFASIILTSLTAEYGLIMGLSIANTAGYTKRAASSSGIFIGYCLGNFVGPQVFLATESPRYPTGFIVVLATTAAAAVLALVYRAVCIFENRRRDRSGTMESFSHAFEDPTDKENKHFRYVL